MKLNPVDAKPEPAYPTYRPLTQTLRKLTAAAAVSAALWLPACGDDTEDVALPGAMAPIENIQPAGTPTPPLPPATEYKPPEPIVPPLPPESVTPPAPPVRLAGRRMPPTPPSR